MINEETPEGEENWEMVVDDASSQGRAPGTAVNDERTVVAPPESAVLTSLPVEQEMTIEFSPSKEATEAPATKELRKNEVGCETAPLLDEQDERKTVVPAESGVHDLSLQNNGSEPQDAPATTSVSFVHQNHVEPASVPSQASSKSQPQAPLLSSTAGIAKTFRRATHRLKKSVQPTLHETSQKIQQNAKSGVELLRNGTVAAGQQVSASARDVGRTVQRGTAKACDTVHRSYVEHDVEGKTRAAAQTVQQTARSLGSKAKAFNDRYHIVETVASTAAVVGALRLARGDVRGGVTSLGLAGATFAASEAMHHRPAQHTGLNENIHLD